MECHLFRLLVQRYYDGELDPAERAEYENHRRRCEACRALDGRFATIVAALDGAPRFEPSADFNSRVLSRIDIASYRVTNARRAARAVARGWNAMPIPLRNAVSVAAVCVVFIAVYQPLLDYMIMKIRQGAEALWSAALFARELGGKIEMIWNGISTVRNYEIVGATLLRTIHRFVSGLNPFELALGAASVLVVAIALRRLLGVAQRKGESNVCIL